jgi:hypothetical protein
MFENIDVETLTFVTWNVHYDMCAFHFTSSTISNEITRLHHNYKFLKNMLKEHCVGNYFTLDGLVNVVYGTFVDYTKTIQPCYYG